MIPPLASFTNNLARLVGADQQDVDRLRDLKEGVPGWSELAHYLVFRELLRAKRKPEPLRILVVGVYHGLDLRYLAGIADDMGQPVRLEGVDLFSDGELPDWPEDVRGKGLTWQQAMNCPPPSMEAAKENCPTAQLHKCDSVEFMQAALETNQCYDIILLDGSHDARTVSREIAAARAILYPDGILLGDDYHWMAHGGVNKAVQALLPNHILLFNRIWLAAA